MKLLLIFLLVLVVNLCICKKRNRNYKIDIKTGKTIRISTNLGANQKKKDILNKMKGVANLEDFLKMFKIPFKKVIKTKSGNSFNNKGLDGGFTRITSSKSKPKITDGKAEYNFVLSSSSSSKNGFPKLSSSTTSNDSPASLDDTALACKPRSTVYSLPYSEAYTNYPSCFELNQCGGCCSNLPGHVCGPTELHVEKKQVVRIYYVGGYSIETITLTHHKKCGCQCKTQPSDCLSTQYYDNNYCGCFCRTDQAACPTINQEWSPTKCQCICKKRYECNYRQIWDEKTCGCQCRRIPCSKGQIQDPSTCLCLITSSQI